MAFVIAGIIIIVIDIIIATSVDSADPTLAMKLKYGFTALSTIGLLLAVYPFLRTSFETSKLYNDTKRLENEINSSKLLTESAAETLMSEIDEHNDNVNRYFDEYNLWFGTPMFQHDTAEYIVNTEKYEIASKETENALSEETTKEHSTVPIGGIVFALVIVIDLSIAYFCLDDI